MVLQFLFRLVYIYFFISISTVKAQDNPKINQLKKLLKNEISDSLRAHIYYDLGLEYQSVDTEKGFYFTKEGLNISKKAKLESCISTGFSRVASYYLRKTNITMASKYVDSALVFAKSSNNDKALALAYRSKGNIFTKKGEYLPSIENLLISLRISEKINDSISLANCNINLGEVYQQLGKLELAEKYVLVSLNILRKLEDQRRLVSSMHTLANIYGQGGNYQKALDIDKEALKISVDNNNLLGKAMIYSNMANCYIYMKQPEKAIFYHKQVLETDILLGDSQLIGDSYMNIGNTYLENNQSTESVKWLKDAVETFRKIKFPTGEHDAMMLLSKAYANLGDFKKAYNLKEQEIILSDSLLNEKNTRQMAELQTEFDTEKKDRQINSLNQENTIQKLELKSKNLYIYMGIVLLILSTVFGLLFHNRLKLKQASKFQKAIILQQDLSSRAIVEAEERESKRIAGDLHDGVGQLFAAVKLNLSGLGSDVEFKSEYSQQLYTKTLDLVDDACSEVRTISHNLMPNVLLKAGLASAIREFISKIDSKKLRVNLQTAGLDERLDSKIETVLYRIVQESVNNVIKHAKADQLDIQIIKELDEVTATIEDNGKGFNTDSIKNSEGIGLKNIQSRVDFLKGSVEWDSAIGRGTVVSIHIPLA